MKNSGKVLEKFCIIRRKFFKIFKNLWTILRTWKLFQLFQLIVVMLDKIIYFINFNTFTRSRKSSCRVRFTLEEGRKQILWKRLAKLPSGLAFCAECGAVCCCCCVGRLVLLSIISYFTLNSVKVKIFPQNSISRLMCSRQASYCYTSRLQRQNDWDRTISL